MIARLPLFVLSVACLLCAGPALADDDDDEARALRAAGDLRPLSELIEHVESTCQGRFVETELEEDDGVWVYEIKLLGPAGDVAELEYDARDFDLLEAEGKRLDRLGCVPAGTPD